MADEQPHQITETEAALIDAIRTLIDIIVRTNVASASTVDGLLEMHQKRHEKEARPISAAVISLLRHLSTNADVQARRDADLKLRSAPPKGSA